MTEHGSLLSDVYRGDEEEAVRTEVKTDSCTCCRT